MRELVAIKIKILRGAQRRNGQVTVGNVYPDFNAIDPALRDHMDWSHYFDVHGLSWHYDETVKSKTETLYGVTCVPEPFALEAARLFPDTVTLLTEAEFEDFYNNKAHANEPDEFVDSEALQAILLKQQLVEKGLIAGPVFSEVQRRARALDPEDPTPGLRRNKTKTWADFKKMKNVQIKSPPGRS